MQLLMNLLGVPALSIDVPAGEVNCGLATDLPSFASLFRSHFYINDFFQCGLMHPSNISAHATEWGPALAKTGPGCNMIL